MSDMHHLLVEHIIASVDAYRSGQAADLELIAAVLQESDDAKQLLRRKGYGWTGLGLLLTAELVPSNE